LTLIHINVSRTDAAFGQRVCYGWEGGASMRTFFVEGLVALAIASPALAQGAAQRAPGQQGPGQQSPGQQTVRPPQSVGAKPESLPGKPTAAGTAQTTKPAAASTPESRSAAALALSADPVFDDGTYLRIKQTLLSCSDIDVRGADRACRAKLAPGASGAALALLRRHLVVTGDLPANAEAGDSYDDAVTGAVKKFQLRHGLEPSGSVGARTTKALNVPVKDRIKQLEASRCAAWIFCLPSASAVNAAARRHAGVQSRQPMIRGCKDPPTMAGLLHEPCA
jgi:L,D-transpeptidase YcbB